MAAYEFGGSTEQREWLAALGAILTDCREVFLQATNDGMLDLHRESRAAFDLGLQLSGPRGRWTEDVTIHPRALAVKLVRQQVDFCAALGTIVAAGEVFDPMSSLVRSVVEFATRAFWVIDPSADSSDDPGLGHRVRSARAHLTELVSVHHFRDALSGRPEVAEQRARLKKSWRSLSELARSTFDPVELDGDPGKWSLEGQRYASWTEIAATWSALEGSGVNGGGLYKLLAVESHPQGFSGTRGFRGSTDGPERVVTTEDVKLRVQLAVASTYSAVMLLANYHDYSSAIFEAWERQIDSALPGAIGEGGPENVS